MLQPRTIYDNRRRASRPSAAILTIALLALVAAGCGDDKPASPKQKGRSAGGAGFKLASLRDASTCPLELAVGAKPGGLELGAPDVDVSEHGKGVEVGCSFPVTGSAEDEVDISIVAAPSGTDVFDLETETGGSWINLIHNSTGVEQDELENAVDRLSGDDVELLEARDPVALRRVDIAGGGSGLLLVYGDRAQTGEQLSAVASALT